MTEVFEAARSEFASAMKGFFRGLAGKDTAATMPSVMDRPGEQAQRRGILLRNMAAPVLQAGKRIDELFTPSDDEPYTRSFTELGEASHGSAYDYARPQDEVLRETQQDAIDALVTSMFAAPVGPKAGALNISTKEGLRMLAVGARGLRKKASVEREVLGPHIFPSQRDLLTTRLKRVYPSLVKGLRNIPETRLKELDALRLKSTIRGYPAALGIHKVKKQGLRPGTVELALENLASRPRSESLKVIGHEMVHKEQFGPSADVSLLSRAKAGKIIEESAGQPYRERFLEKQAFLFEEKFAGAVEALPKGEKLSPEAVTELYDKTLNTVYRQAEARGSKDAGLQDLLRLVDEGLESRGKTPKLRVAVRLDGVVYEGIGSELHGSLAGRAVKLHKAKGLVGKEFPEIESGFADASGRFLTREEALRVTAPAQAEFLESQGLPAELEASNLLKSQEVQRTPQTTAVDDLEILLGDFKESDFELPKRKEPLPDWLDLRPRKKRP